MPPPPAIGDSDKELLIVNTDSIGDYILFRNFLSDIKKSPAYRDYKITLLGCTTFKAFAECLDGDIVDHFLWVPNRPQERTFIELEYQRRDLHKNQGMKPFYDTVCFSSFNSGVKKTAHDYLLSDVNAKHRIINYDIRNKKNCSDLLPFTYVHADRAATEKFDFDNNKAFFKTVLNIENKLTYPKIEDDKINLNVPEVTGRVREYVVINPCAYDPYRMWHPENWCALIRHLKNKGYDIVCVCAPKEQAYCRSLIDRCGVDVELHAGLPVQNLLAVLKLAKLYIGQDSGIFHVAAALNIRALCLSAGNAYFRFMNYPKTRRNIKVLFPKGVEEWILQNKDDHPDKVNDVNNFFINNLRVSDVTAAADDLLAIKEVVFVNKFKTKNTGDREICPYDYFPEYFNQYVVQRIDIDDIDKVFFKNAVFILGGGGMIDQNDNWNRWINILAEKHPVIAWGIGFNHHYDAPALKTALNFKKLALVGLRDFDKGYPYLPCVSCLKKELDITAPIKREIGCITHYENTKHHFDWPTIYNNAPFQDLIRFIAESRVIVTNTYHMVYWATLMGKKVILYKPFSNRFDALQFKPVTYSGDITSDIKKANVYPKALAECRQRNIAFFEKVKHIIET